MKVLVTGGAGYLGSVLVDRLLKNGHQVVVLDNLFRVGDYMISHCSNPNFQFIYGDILDVKTIKNAMNGIEGVVHLAALVGEPICKRLGQLATLVNVAGSQHVIDNTPEGVPLIVASTGSVYGRVDGICTEQSPLNAISHYAKTKISMEDLAQDKAVIYRFSTAFGISGNIRVDLLVNDLVYRAVNEGSLVMFQADFRRSFIHSRDIASAIEFGLLNYDMMRSQVYNVGHPEGNWSKRRLAEYIKEKTGCFVCYAETGYKDPDQRDYEIDFGKMKNAGWEAGISIEAGLDELLKAVKIMKITHRYM